MLKCSYSKAGAPYIRQILISIMRTYIKGAALKINAITLDIIRNMSLSSPGKRGFGEHILDKKASVGSSI